MFKINRNVKIVKLTAISLSISFFISGCAPLNPQKDASFHEKAVEVNRPVVRPTRSISSFSDSLMCMDHLFRDSGMNTVLVTSKSIPDYSGKIAVATKEMIVTALSQMSRVSNAFRFVDYEVNIAQQDTVQNLTTLLLNNNQVTLQRPALYVSGAVAFVDQQVMSNTMDMGTSASRLETGYSNNKRSTVIGLEMHLGDFKSRTIIPGLDSANEIVIGSGGQGLDLSGRIGNYGVQFNVGRDYTQGSGPAIRTLVELSMIELFGKWARVPYWQCLTLEQSHPDFIRQMRHWFDSSSQGEKKKYIERILFIRGYIPSTDPTPSQFKDALTKFQADHRIVTTGILDFPTYEKSFSDYVGLNSEGHLERIGWQKIENDTNEVAAAGGKPIEIDLQIENILLGRNHFLQGEQVFLSAKVSRASFLSCYMKNSRNEFIKILPNSTNKTGWVSANQTIRIPDWMSPTPGFVLDAGQPGQEGVGCVATESAPANSLPETLQADAFKILPGVQSFHAIENGAASLAENKSAFGFNKIEWQVMPKSIN